tara:strand:- start:40 stop:435 length:396 start_codon:yes stop_codon:yes gene_type:complete
MAATIYNGVMQGTGADHTQTLYTNNTGGNVRLIFNYFETGAASPGIFRIYIGTSNAPNHPNGQDLDTMELNPPSSTIYGKNVNGPINEAGNAWPTEFMLANNNSIWVRMPTHIHNYNKAINYNFTVIPETN